MWNALILVLVEMPKFQFVQPNPIHSQTLLSRTFGLFLWKGRMNAKKLGFERNIHKLVYKHGSASPEDRGHLQSPASPRESVPSRGI